MALSNQPFGEDVYHLKYFLYVAGAALVGFSFVGQGPANGQLKAHVASLQAAKSLKATVAVSVLPAAPETYTLSYSKPNLFKIDSSTELIVCDGNTTTTLDKRSNTYVVQQAAAIPVTSDALFAWSAFFDPKAYSEAKSVSVGAKRKIKGKAVTELLVTLPTQTLTLYIDDAAGFARGASSESNKGEKHIETLTIMEDMSLGVEPLALSEFTFIAPLGAKLQEAPKIEEVAYSKVQAIFDRSCVRCHGGGQALSLTSYSELMAGAAGRPVVRPGDPKNSLLVQYIEGSRSPRMPKGGPSLSAADIKLISDWIAGGAKGN
jgi:outer membrane lipoprotein-sorting protein